MMHIKLLPTLVLLLALSSCYSIRVSNVKGVGEPDPTNFEEGFYRGLKVVELDTTVNLKLLQNQVLALETCPSAGFHSFEYRVTLGSALLSGITLSKKRKIKVKYVCLKESN